MTSLLASLVKSALRAYTYPYRKAHRSLSRSIEFKDQSYMPPKGYSYRIEQKNGVNVEILVPKNADPTRSILHFRGGGHTMKLNQRYRNLAARYARQIGCAVYTIDFSTGEALRHPACLIDCFNACAGLLSEGFRMENAVAVGDSMGANLMLATALKLRDAFLPLPRAFVSLSGFLDFSMSGDSYRKNCHSDPMYSLPRYESYEGHESDIRRKNPYGEHSDLTDPYLSPAFGDYRGFPQILIQCGDIETGESDSDMLFARFKQSGAKAVLTKYRGMFHDFQCFAPFLKESRAAWREIRAFVSEVFEREFEPESD